MGKLPLQVSSLSAEVMDLSSSLQEVQEVSPPASDGYGKRPNPNPNSRGEIVYTQHITTGLGLAGNRGSRGAGARVSVRCSGPGPCTVDTHYYTHFCVLHPLFLFNVCTTKSSAFTAKIILGTDFEV